MHVNTVRGSSKEGLIPDVWMLNDTNNDEYRNNYKELNKNVKRAVKKQKNDNLQSKIREMEENPQLISTSPTIRGKKI